MKRDPIDYQIVIRYLDASASEEDRRQARELLLKSPEARAYLSDVAGQMVHLIDRNNAYLEASEDESFTISCQLQMQPGGPAEAGSQEITRNWPVVFNDLIRLRRYAGSLLFVTVLLFSAFAFSRSSKVNVSLEPSLQISDYLGQLTVNHGQQSFKSPFRDVPRITAGDMIETHNWLSWAELKMDSGAVLTVPVNSKIIIKSLSKERMEVDVIAGCVRFKSAKDDPFQVVIHSERLHVVTSVSEVLVSDFSFGRAIAGCFSGTAEVSSVDETQNVHVESDWMATTDYNDAELRLSRHPEIVHRWSSQGMKEAELGTGIWKNPDNPGTVKLLAAPKTYIYPDGSLHQIQEILLACWRRPDTVKLKAGSRLIVSGRYAKPGPVSFALRTHSVYGKLLDIFVKTMPPDELSAPGESWRVEIPVEEMMPTFRPGQASIGSLLFNISMFTDEEIGLEVNSIELSSPD